MFDNKITVMFYERVVVVNDMANWRLTNKNY